MNDLRIEYTRKPDDYFDAWDIDDLGGFCKQGPLSGYYVELETGTLYHADTYWPGTDNLRPLAESFNTAFLPGYGKYWQAPSDIEPGVSYAYLKAHLGDKVKSYIKKHAKHGARENARYDIFWQAYQRAVNYASGHWYHEVWTCKVWHNDTLIGFGSLGGIESDIDRATAAEYQNDLLYEALQHATYKAEQYRKAISVIESIDIDQTYEAHKTKA